MKFTLVFFFMALVSMVFSLPATSHQDHSVHYAPLLERGIDFPTRADDLLAAKIMAQLERNFDTNVFASVAATFCKKALASLKVRAFIGGIFEISEDQLKVFQYNVAGNLKNSFEIIFNAKIKARIYDPIKTSLYDRFNDQELNESLLLDILEELNAHVKLLIKIELPKIGADLQAKAKEKVESAVKSVRGRIMMVINIYADVGVYENSSLEAAIQVALDACARLNTKANARLILQGL